MSDLDKYLTAAHEAVDVADAILRASRDHAVAFKGDRDPVTETDLAIERAMRDSLRRTTPEAGFLAKRPAAAPMASLGFWTRSTAPPTSPTASR
jgi:myo-inositol-1(or 4)-monophosphatase